MVALFSAVLFLQASQALYLSDTEFYKIKRDYHDKRDTFQSNFAWWSISKEAGIQNGTGGAVDGPGASASFDGIWGIVADANGNLYAADTYNNKIRKITSDGTVSTFAGTGAQGNNDGAASSATFSLPFGIAIDKDGNLYVSDFGINNIRK